MKGRPPARAESAPGVVVTGMGVVTPVGCAVETFWNSVLPGTSGVRRIRRFDPTGYGTTIAAEVDDAGYLPAASPRLVRRLDRFTAHEVPDRVMVVESFPLLSNGKIDRSYLTESARSARLSARHDSGAQPIGVGRSAPESRGTVRGTTA